MNDTEIIAFLGGQTALANELGVNSSRVGNWLSRGIPWPYRAQISRMVKAKAKTKAEKITLPENFLEKRITSKSDEAA